MLYQKNGKKSNFSFFYDLPDFFFRVFFIFFCIE